MDVGEGCWLLRIEVASSTSRLLTLEEIDGTVIKAGCVNLYLGNLSSLVRSYLARLLLQLTTTER